MTIELRIANNNDSEEWNTIISQSPQGTLFHQWNWLKITEKHTQMKLYPLIAIKYGLPIGVFPLFFQKKGPVRSVFSPPPHAGLLYLGPALIGFERLKQGKRETNYNEFLNSIENFITEDLRANFISISLSPSLQDIRHFVWSGYMVEPHYDYVTDISIGTNSLLQTLDKRRRQNLNHARKRGIYIEIGGKKELEAILDMMEKRYAQQGKILTTSRHYYLDIYDAYSKNLIIFVAKADGDIVSGSIDFQYRDTHYSWIGNPKPIKHISPSPNDLLIWESICYAYEHGLRYYVSMNAAGNKRLHSYYASKFDPELKIHFSVKKKSYFTNIMEKGYTNIIKPLKGKIYLYRFGK